MRRVLPYLAPLALTPLALTSCQKSAPPLPPPHPHYVIGSAWQGSDGWFYPSESFSLRQTGLAVRENRMRPHVTTDGEIWSAESMTGAHQTLQLPAIVTLRNLTNGRTVRIRLNDRGPSSRGRIVAVTPKVADLLGIGGDAPAPVELVVDEAASRAIAESSPDAPKLDVAAAPRGDVTAESLDAPPGRDRHLVGGRQETAQAARSGMRLEPLPANVTQGFSQPVSYAITLGSFAGHGAASQVALRCGGRVSPVTDSGTGLNWQVRLGPFATVPEADMELARARGCGIAGARIVVE
ncbi:hypothetical protein [Acidomonas methanolica]|uniref:Lipoprotein n=1 Tax=Acidomonas methanolica NBRC 104435 TaxID=1231351 RepID=A0A023D6D0_ACIMT|nr:hypothetical protein [Acidomonas methanolica]MBU2653197.1 hypothetical protein [Acidomonas methanolica]TCS32146.1 rare lipoprotein A [Acidomonas methanolica]GAJ29376.1 lipoprotein [Acidomonas methanolica NBRC 104435]GBQ49974.1 lipoprotein [Acidomonas methanolica]GEK97579.1 hypothetical protein AME01nite_00780 [Acidomonas methanolica NBRC 104435]